MNNILVTGGCGFIGSHLVERLGVTKQYKVIVIDNFQTGLNSNLIENSEVTICEGNVSDPQFIENVFIKHCPSIVIHAAASYKCPADWHGDIATNIVGMANLVQSSIKHQIDKFIYLQTSLCYGLDPISLPVKIGDPYFNGSYYGGSSYAISKTAAELYLSLSGLNFISFRLANVYGPRNFSGPIPIFYANLKNNIKSRVYKTKRDFIFVSDVVNCIIKSLKTETFDSYFNISTGLDIEISEIYLLLEKELGKSNDYDLFNKGGDDTSTILLDSSKTKEVFDWEPKTSLKEGIRKTLLYYSKHGVDNTYTHLVLNK